MSTKINKTFIIRHKVTKEQWIAGSGKSSWKQIGHAKSAWANMDHKDTKDIIPLKRRSEYREWYEYPYFADQDAYECVELKHESEEKLQRALDLLQRSLPCLGTGYTGIYEDIDNFIKENRVD
tara:strand:+ start:1130 stop:1498 length:369 start_codon:yes stop_codon:yes gene_type:complete